jgi:hypothetical protein
MKKHTFYGFVMAFLAIVVVSCGKSNSRKITNDWTIVSSEQEQTGIDEDGDKTYTHTSFTETTISTHSEYTPVGGVTTAQESSGKVSANTISIKKDGTWIWNQEWSYEIEQGGSVLNTNIKTIQSGTWNFVAKTKGDDFKKNERIAFNILKESKSTFQTQDQVMVTSNGSEITFLAGENMLIYTIVESKNKELELKLEKNSESTENGEVNKTSLAQNMILKEK